MATATAKNLGKSTLRTVKNYTKGYSDVQTKVREATSNDGQWDLVELQRGVDSRPSSGDSLGSLWHTNERSRSADIQSVRNSASMVIR